MIKPPKNDRTTKQSVGEYVRYDGDAAIHSNKIENDISALKRGIIRAYRASRREAPATLSVRIYFRYSNRVGLAVDDKERAKSALRGIVGKRLFYHGSFPAS